MLKKVKTLITWLNDRDWQTDKLERSISKYEREIEDARVEAVQSLLGDLNGYIMEAKLAAEDCSLSRRERQIARLDVRCMRATVEDLEQSLTPGQMPLYFEGKVS